MQILEVDRRSPRTLSALLDKKKTKIPQAADFYNIGISLASSATIRSWSYGRVKKAETINYRTFKPERDGLFCEVIFGPTKDYECSCGKYKGMKFKGVICDHCGVEITTSNVRRRRMGHIELACPVAHIWFVKIIPSPIGLLLDISAKDLERVIYYEMWIVTDPGDTPLKEKQILSDAEYTNYRIKYGSSFKAGMGAEAIKELLKKINIKELAESLRKEMKKDTKSVKKLEIVRAFLKSKNKPEWMILDVLPVLPPELRPMVQLKGGRFASSDLNDLYRRIINRNNRLEKLLELKAPEIIVRNEKRMLQEAVDALFDNSRRRRPLKSSTGRPLKSLSDMLKGKQGRFRQNLLGKRVDYSGRSVIVVDPKLKLHQCGLPKRMAMELFQPFLIRRLIEKGWAHNIKTAKRTLERGDEKVYKLLEEVIKNHPVLLNRAPTLHRLGIQAFEPVLVDDDSIKIHPLVCTAFNADFDGDQMAVHIPLSVEAQLESRLLMLSSYNLLSPAHGKPLTAPTHDMVLGIYYLTFEGEATKCEKYFDDYDEVKLAYEEGVVGLHTRIYFNYGGGRIETTVGRVIFNEILPEEIRFINKEVDKKELNEIIATTYRKCGNDVTVELLDKIKELGFNFATVSGLTISLDDMIIPKQKEELIATSNKQVEHIQIQYQSGAITEEERYNKIVDLWTYVVEEITSQLVEILRKDKKGLNPIYMMMYSGARGNKQQVRQLCGMRGLMAKPSGEIIELPITSNFREGLSILEYFISTHGARKGLADTALKTADAGYLTRRLVDVAHDVVVTEYDCGTLNGIVVEAIKEGDEIIEKLSDRILGRVALDDIVDPRTGKLLVRANEEIDEEAVKEIEDADIERIRIRSVFTCETRRGVCAKCYGRNLATGRMVDIGEAVGIIAAQSIGEPGTQLTMRTFHIGGTAFKPIEERVLSLPYKIEVVSIPKKLIKLSDKASIVYRQGELVIKRILFELPITPQIKPVVFDGLWVNVGDEIAQRLTEGGDVEKILTNVAGTIRIISGKLLVVARERSITLRCGTKLWVTEGEIVEENRVIAEMDPYNEPILTEVSGIVKFKDITLDRTLKEELDENTGLFRRVIVEDKEGKLQPRILIYKDQNTMPVSYILPHGARLVVNEGDRVEAGSVLAKFPQELIRTRDITGGMPRVAELFEARRPKNVALVSEIDGVVKFKNLSSGRRLIIIENPQTKEKREYEVSMGRHLRVHEGDEIYAGTPLTNGAIAPQDILAIKGEKLLQQYLLSEIEEVYRLQGVEINDKHIEVIIRQMLRKVRITDAGDSDFLVNELVDRFVFMERNEEVLRRGGSRPAKAQTVLLGITKASLLTDSFISAASFQETTRVLMEAAIRGARDELKGLKENVVIGKLISAGTGFSKYRENLEIISKDSLEEILSIKKQEEDDYKSIIT